MFAEFIERTRSNPFEWGVNDCALWCGAAVADVTGYDPASDLRATYSTWFGCRKVVMRAGGLVNLIAPRMKRFGPLDGDGVAIARLGGQSICGLIIGEHFVVKMQTGLQITTQYDMLRGWSCPKL